MSAEGPVDTRADIEAALKVLGDRADEVIQQTAGQVFITTAVSQNGSLDSVVVLAAQSKMTWTLEASLLPTPQAPGAYLPVRETSRRQPLWLRKSRTSTWRGNSSP